MNHCESELNPGTHCALCGKPYAETGGHRILGQQWRGVGFSNRPVGGGNPKNRNICIPLEGENEFYIVFSGPDGFWTDEAMQRAIEMYHKKEYPYLCSSCAKRTCAKCGAPLKRPPGSTYMTDDGVVLHAQIAGGSLGCQNPACEDF